MSGSLEHQRLRALATEIGTEVDAAQAAWTTAVHHAINAGERLVEAKSLCQHGEWAKWIQANLTITQQHANTYMRMYQRRDEIENASSIRDAIGLLAPPKVKQPSELSLAITAAHDLAEQMCWEVETWTEDKWRSLSLRDWQSMVDIVNALSEFCIHVLTKCDPTEAQALAIEMNKWAEDIQGTLEAR